MNSSRRSSPIWPSRIRSLIIRKGLPNRRWWLKVNRQPARSQAAAMRLQSPHVTAMGFSQWMAFSPASAQVTTMSACSGVQVEMLTMSSCSCASICS